MTANQGAGDDVNTKQEPTMSETMQGKPDLTVCRSGDVCQLRDGTEVPFGGESPHPGWPYRAGILTYRRDGAQSVIAGRESTADIIAILRDGVQISPPVSKPDHIADAGKMVEPVNAGAVDELQRVRAGLTTFLWKVQRGVIQMAEGDRLELEWILEPHRPAPSPGQVTETEDKDARIAELEALVEEAHAIISVITTEDGDDVDAALWCQCAGKVRMKPAPASPAESPEPVEDNLDELRNYTHVHYPQPAAPVPAGQVVDGPGKRIEHLTTLLNEATEYFFDECQTFGSAEYIWLILASAAAKNLCVKCSAPCDESGECVSSECCFGRAKLALVAAVNEKGGL